GYGNKLMEFIENKLISQHQSQEKSSKLLMTLVVAVNNIPAINLYKKRGYTIIKKIMGYYSSNEDGYLMVKKLQS
ncbi:MAG: N-acetyltransferase, partial [Asgard group archaeon]|nr:N-acetyltransferase [Asgard group archaeon]